MQSQMKQLNCSPVIEQSSPCNESNPTQPFTTTGQRRNNQNNTLPSLRPGESNTLPQRSLRSTKLGCGLLCRAMRSDATLIHQSSHERDEHKRMEKRAPLTLTYHAYLAVRYYPMDPTWIADEQTRYQIFLQVRSDLVSGRMQVDEEMFVTLCGLILQSDCGDYGEEKLGATYVRALLKLAQLSPRMEANIKTKHIESRCRQPALVEYQFLDKVKHLATYGQVKFTVKDVVSHMQCSLNLNPFGVSIEETEQNVIRFPWTRIAGFSRKNRHLLIRITDGNRKFTYHYALEDQAHCQRLLKLCKKYHIFYKCELLRIGGRIPGLTPAATTVPELISVNTQPANYNSTLVSQPPPILIPCPTTTTITMTNSNSARPTQSDPMESVAVQTSVLLKQAADRGVNPYQRQYRNDNSNHPHNNNMNINDMAIPTVHPLRGTPSQINHPGHVAPIQPGEMVYHPWVEASYPMAVPLPPNPYHVPPAAVYYRPRGCATAFEYMDGQSTTHYSTRTDPLNHHRPRRILPRHGVPHNHQSYGSHYPTNNQLRSTSSSIRHSRRAFPQTKHYWVDQPCDTCPPSDEDYRRERTWRPSSDFEQVQVAPNRERHLEPVYRNNIPEHDERRVRYIATPQPGEFRMSDPPDGHLVRSKRSGFGARYPSDAHRDNMHDPVQWHSVRARTNESRQWNPPDEYSNNWQDSSRVFRAGYHYKGEHSQIDPNFDYYPTDLRSQRPTPLPSSSIHTRPQTRLGYRTNESSREASAVTRHHKQDMADAFNPWIDKKMPVSLKAPDLPDESDDFESSRTLSLMHHSTSSNNGDDGSRTTEYGDYRCDHTPIRAASGAWTSTGCSEQAKRPHSSPISSSSVPIGVHVDQLDELSTELNLPTPPSQSFLSALQDTQPMRMALPDSLDTGFDSHDGGDIAVLDPEAPSTQCQINTFQSQFNRRLPLTPPERSVTQPIQPNHSYPPTSPPLVCMSAFDPRDVNGPVSRLDQMRPSSFGSQSSTDRSQLDEIYRSDLRFGVTNGF